MIQNLHIPIPAPLKMTSSSIAADWKRFKSQYLNYEVAAELLEKSKTNRAAVFLARKPIRHFQIFDFDEDEDNDETMIM